MNAMRLAWVLLGTAATVMAPSARGQYYVQQGNVLDANNRIGSGGLNYGARRYDINATNRLVTGNITGGRSFQGFSPVRDPSSFYGSSVSGLLDNSNIGLSGGGSALPSDRLAGFRRDSYGIVDPNRNINIPAPYYSISSTVANTGAIARNLNQPGTSQLRSSYELPRADLRVTPGNPLDTAQPGGSVGNPLIVQPRLVRADTGKLITGDVNARLLNSPLFGAVRLGDLAAQASGAQSSQAGTPSPLDLRIGSRTPVDLRVNSLVDQRVFDSPAGRTSESLAREPGSVPDRGEPVSGEMASGSLFGPTATASLFDRMRTTNESLARPVGPTADASGEAAAEGGAGRGTLLQPTVAAGQPGAEGTPQAPLLPAEEGGGAMTPGPLRTFVGTEQSTINRYLAQAEIELKAGNYYKAADAYSLAQMIDNRNPLPILGRSMALLAAGDYLSSSNDLFQAIRLFDGLARYDVDLKQFIPDLDTLDRRRAYLEQRLASFDDFRLRFLLGYAEYSSGLTDIGLANMKKAAASAPPQLEAIPRFVEALAVRHGTAEPIHVPENK